MSKPKRKRRPSAGKSKSGFDHLSNADLVRKGEALITSDHYREAIDVYKQLLKREIRPDWQHKLADAYLQRARLLAAKDMLKEAAMLWQNRAALCASNADIALHPELYIDWTLQAGQYEQAVRGFLDHRSALNKADAVRLQSCLSALLLSGNPIVEQLLPTDDALLQQRAPAVAALQAYCQGKSEAEVRKSLKLISFRSPYRELRPLLAGLLKFESDPTEAARLLTEMTATSPYARLAGIACRVLDDSNRTEAFTQLSPAQTAFAAALLDLDQRQQELLRQYTALGDDYNDKALLNFIVNHVGELDCDQAQRSALALLVSYPQGKNLYTKHFGAIPEFEHHRLQALSAERRHDFDGAENAWGICVDRLSRDTLNSDNRLMAALILRHLATLSERAFGPDDPAIEDYLEESLELDPDDKECYLKLARLHQRKGNQKNYYYWAEQAVAHFPQDSATLLLATEAASARNAFKKAAGFAQQLLKLDPINRQARRSLIEAHLAHARKQIKARRLDLAEKELASAEKLGRDGNRDGAVEINQGLIAFRRGDKALAKSKIDKGLQAAGNGLTARFRLWLEADRQELSARQFHSYAQAATSEDAQRDVMMLLNLINADRHTDGKRLQRTLDAFRNDLKKVPADSFSQEQLQAICDCFHQLPYHELLEYFATIALKKWSEKPLFVYYQLRGRSRNRPVYMLPMQDLDRLEQALDNAKEQEDHRVVMLINQFLGPIPSMGRGPTRPPKGSLPLLPEEIFDDLEQLRDQYHSAPPDIRNRMIRDLTEPLGDLPDGLAEMLVELLLSDEDLDDDDDDWDDDWPDDDPDLLPFDLPLPDQLPLPLDFDRGAPPRRKKKKSRKKRKK